LKVSIGVASYPEDGATRATDLLSLMEKNLNRAKEYGGNRIHALGQTGPQAVPGVADEGSDEILYLKEKITKLNKQANQNIIESIFALARTIELKDQCTGDHVERVVFYATEIANKFHLPDEQIENLKQAAILHDLGKIGISESILRKPTKLTDEEFELIKKHPLIAVDIIRPIHFLHHVIPLILYHHERWDGKGYPERLKSEEIPLGARILAVADVYQALTSDRPYRKAYSKGEALSIMQENAGTQFDPKIVPILVDIVNAE
jgi:HD-GYP domain-containing protein (c-di-GMP phosphodiesterase class II)